MHVQYHYSRHLRLASIDGERSRFCPEDRDDELEEYHLRAAERNLSWDATLNKSVNWNGRSPSRWTGICSNHVLLLLKVSDYGYGYFH